MLPPGLPTGSGLPTCGPVRARSTLAKVRVGSSEPPVDLVENAINTEYCLSGRPGPG